MKTTIGTDDLDVSNDGAILEDGKCAGGGRFTNSVYCPSNYWPYQHAIEQLP